MKSLILDDLSKVFYMYYTEKELNLIQFARKASTMIICLEKKNYKTNLPEKIVEIRKRYDEEKGLSEKPYNVYIYKHRYPL